VAPLSSPGTLQHTAALRSETGATTSWPGARCATRNFNFGKRSPEPRDEALVALWEQYAKPVRRYAKGLTGDREASQDILQETFLRAWRHLDKLDKTRPLPWLLVVARNVAYGLARKHSLATAHKHSLATAHKHSLATGGQDPERAAEAPAFGLPGESVLDHLVLSEALGRLSRAHREVLEAIFVQGDTILGAARRLGLPPGTVKSRTYYALRALRLHLEEVGYQP
jgi:RNA polymerase sigma-70 factor (ECF subfamily)